MIRVLCGHDTMTALVVTLTHALFFFFFFTLFGLASIIRGVQ